MSNILALVIALFLGNMPLQGGSGGRAPELGWLWFGCSSFLPICPAPQPVLPNSHLPKQNLANNGLTKIKSTLPRCATTRITLYKNSIMAYFWFDIDVPTLNNFPGKGAEIPAWWLRSPRSTGPRSTWSRGRWAAPSWATRTAARSTATTTQTAPGKWISQHGVSELLMS